MRTWYFTFGCGYPLAKHVQPIHASSYEAARLKMRDAYGEKWSSQHDEAAWKEVSEKYGPYTELPSMEVGEWEAGEIEKRIGR